MRDRYRFLWLEGIFDQETVNNFKTISPASNFWQKGFVQELIQQGHEVEVIGYAAERVWPFGRLIVGRHQASLLEGLRGKVVGYLNTPFLRPVFQYVHARRAVKASLRAAQTLPNFQVVFSCLEKASDETPAIRIAKYVRRRFGIPWVCIVADGAAPPGADAYVYLPWSYYQSEDAPRPAIHIDGGIADLPPVPDAVESPVMSGQEKVLMYMGALTQHGGVTELARAFQQVPGPDMRLWVCGRGENPELIRLAAEDLRIELKGFVNEAELNKLAQAAWAFANPRPHGFAPNKLNYPSKVLHYLAYGKPIISTFTEGISPAYEDVLVPVPDESDASLSEAIVKAMNMPTQEYEAYQRRIAAFGATHTWAYQVERFVSWLDNLKRGAPANEESL